MSIEIFFGPYNKYGVIRHKTQGLRGVLKALTALGYEIELVPIRNLNTVTIRMMNNEIFRCNINNLLFNIDYDEDTTAQKIVKAVKDAYAIFYSEANIPKFPMRPEKVAFQDELPLLFEIGEVGAAPVLMNKESFTSRASLLSKI